MSCCHHVPFTFLPLSLILFLSFFSQSLVGSPLYFYLSIWWLKKYTVVIIAGFTRCLLLYSYSPHKRPLPPNMQQNQITTTVRVGTSQLGMSTLSRSNLCKIINHSSVKRRQFCWITLFIIIKYIFIVKVQNISDSLSVSLCLSLVYTEFCVVIWTGVT